MNTRELAVYALIDILEQGAYNNLTLKKLFAENKELSYNEKAFITEIVNGTLRNLILTDYIINCFSNTKTEKMKSLILNILRISVYQMKFMENIPISAICNEAVKFTKKKKFNGLAGFVNGVLRNIARNLNNIDLPDKFDQPIKYLCIKYSYPEWIIKSWLLEYSYEEIEEICKANNISPEICICVNTNKIDKQTLKNNLENEGMIVKEGRVSSNSLYISKTGDISKGKSFEKGYFHVIDESSMLAVESILPNKGKVIIDVCSAPGGKSFYLSYLMQNEGKIFSRDIYQHKINLMNQAKDRLSIKIIETQMADATIFNEMDMHIADVVILDAPCSGLGLLRKKPDIKYRKILEDIDELVLIQRKILKNCAKYVKKGGILLYSTCTISKKENLDNVNWFCENFNFKLEPINLKDSLNLCSSKKGYIQILPSMFNTDGFFIAKLKSI